MRRMAEMDMYKGKRLEDMTREELIAALKVMGGELLELKHAEAFPPRSTPEQGKE